MNISICGLKKHDEKYEKMLKVLKVCLENDITPPDEVMEYFEGDYPDSESGNEIEVYIPYERIDFESRPGCCLDIKVEDIPDNVFKIRAELYD